MNKAYLNIATPEGPVSYLLLTSGKYVNRKAINIGHGFYVYAVAVAKKGA